ncbi:hypothetical protein WJS89_10610 [Sphingomicrobium sp. XHP0235]|uniref:hypothetical protein n=1 Tax=Sphingomicrobium aquimarinum TaxID=3133971 RepID=UPI0031FE6E32
MADQIQVTKTNAYVVVGLPADNSLKAPKVNLYAILEPGEGDTGGERITGGGVFFNIVRKRT